MSATKPAPAAEVALTYHRGPSRRRFGVADGMSRGYEFLRGVPQQVAAQDATRILAAAPTRFHESRTYTVSETTTHPPTTGTTPTPKEG